VETGDTLETIAKAYHLSADRITAVNGNASSLDKGNTLLIPAGYHEEVQQTRSKAKSIRAHGKSGMPAIFKRASVARRGTHITASRRLSTPLTVHRSVVRSTAFAR
jgi:hypothetical protein